MKRVFHFKKGETHDGNGALEEFLEYLFDYATTSCFSESRKNWKVTIIIEDKDRRKR